ncbi:MAG: alpha/beta hydrolase [Acidobacteriota bacterium]
MRNIWLCGILPLAVALAQPAPAPLPIKDAQTLRLWSGTAPGAQGNEPSDIPSMTVYLPRTTRAGMTAVIILPGGGYRDLAMNHEGRQVANYFNSLGIAAFVLEYRLGPRYHFPVELDDAQRALRTVRYHATDWHIAPDRIGILGFSAGGHLAATASTRFDAGQITASDPVERASSRPDFSILGYPVISLTEAWTHQGSKTNLLGDTPSPDLARTLSADQAVTARTPPTFIFHTNADTAVPAENSLYYFLALRKAGVPAEMHIFETGPHGVGLAQDDPALSEWPKLLVNWLRVHKFVGN